jgi:hypothetical protein
MMRLVYLVANAAWTFTFGDDLLKLENAETRFFVRREDAVIAANAHGLTVDANGVVTAA